MKRLYAILLLGFLALGIAGLSAGSAGAAPANCAPDAAALLADVEDMANPAAYAERPAAAQRGNLAQYAQRACNTACARACAARFGRCATRSCRQQFSACMRGCGC